MRRFAGVFFIVLFSFATSIVVEAQSGKVKLEGRVVNFWTGEGMFGATVYIESLQLGTSTDDEGYYQLMVPRGQFRIQYSRVDLKLETRFVDVTSNKTVNVEMKESVQNLDAVTVYSEAQDARIKNLDVGKNNLDIERISSLPSFMGETDVIKSLILLPGVSTVGEGASGFNVRGGGVDQNLVLQDEAIIFNPSHVFGFFSGFNPAVVDNATLYKSGVPASYGGRLSSVLDVSLKEGDLKEYHGSVGLGLVSAKFSVDGPVVEDKLSFVVGGRSSYSDWMLGLAQDGEFKNSSASFYDLNLKLAYHLNENNKIVYSGYYSNDGFAFASDTAFEWSTFNHSLMWKHIFNDKSLFDLSYVNGLYKFNIQDLNGYDAFRIRSEIGYNKIKGVFSSDLTDRNKMAAGFESILYTFSPGEQVPIGNDSGVENIELEHERSLESAVFIEDEYKFTNKFSVRAGLRFSAYQNFGPGIDYLFGEGDSRRMDNIVDTVTYSSGEITKSYMGLEPRVNVNYIINGSSSIKASYNRNRQYLHLISNTAATTPTDFWKTSNYYIPPEIGDQFAVGYFRNFKNNTIEASVEAYYKTAKDIVDFKNGSKLLMNEYIEADLLNGTGQAYGLEFYVNKKVGRLNGWASYTFSRTFRTVNGTYDDEIISNGEKYPSNYDKPHDMSFALNYKSSPVVTYGFNFTYSTGRPATVPLGMYDISNQTNVFNYSLRNQKRIPDYHRLDVSMTIKSKPKVDRKWDMSWVLAIYNLYGRKNAYSVFFENRYGSPPKGYQLSVLGSPFPSLSVNFEF